MFGPDVVGSVITGSYKRAGRSSTQVAIEVTGLAVIPAGGRLVSYVVGTRVDASSQAGMVVLMRSGCFNPNRIKVEKAAKFEPVDLTDYYVTLGDQSGVFAPLEKVSPEDVDWALSLGGRKLSDYLVK